ncbi:hypothetical protein FACS1894158_03800 [Betaproteobacteria bacterium]|nr:hypothetical protein FACS1894158_03800 [Betaproteobacteria bacterium]
MVKPNISSGIDIRRFKPEAGADYANEYLGRYNPLAAPVRATIGSLIGSGNKSAEASISIADGDEKYLKHVLATPITVDAFWEISSIARYIGVTKNFREVIDCFKVPANETPAGFRLEFVIAKDGLVQVDLVRDISYDRNGQKRPTSFLFSADSANPYEVAPIKDLLANLTCNPGIIYDLFINNPKANVGNRFKTRDEVMIELGNVLGPGCDISVELNNPFESDIGKILEEAARFKEMLSPYRVVIKVPHTGSVNAGNVGELLTGDKKFARRYDQGSTADLLRGHQLALLLREHGYRVNFTLMFEPYQTAMALQAKPYFINSFIRHRESQTALIKRYLAQYGVTDDPAFLKDLRTLLIDKDYLSSTEVDFDLFAVKKIAERIVEYRQADGDDRCDGLDGVRHNLRLLKSTNLPDTRLIICSMEGDYNYPDIDKLLTEAEFADVLDRLVITAQPDYLAKFTSCNQVVSYQRRFMNAANGAK